MPRESTMWQIIGPGLNAGGWHSMRVENPILPGTPDVNWCGTDVGCGVHSEGWVELKWLPAWPVRASTVVRIDHYTPDQRLWIRKRTAAGGNVKLLLRVEKQWLLFRPAAAVEHVGKVPRAQLEGWASHIWMDMIDVEEFKRCLLT